MNKVNEVENMFCYSALFRCARAENNKPRLTDVSRAGNGRIRIYSSVSIAENPMLAAVSFVVLFDNNTAISIFVKWFL